MNLLQRIAGWFCRGEPTPGADQHAHEQYVEKAARGLQTKKAEREVYRRQDNLPWGT